MLGEELFGLWPRSIGRTSDTKGRVQLNDNWVALPALVLVDDRSPFHSQRDCGKRLIATVNGVKNQQTTATPRGRFRAWRDRSAAQSCTARRPFHQRFAVLGDLF